MKKTFAKVFALALCSFLCLGASALELESVEAVEESTTTTTESLLSMTKEEVSIPLEDENYGTLLYYNDFDASAPYQNSDILGDTMFVVVPENNNGADKGGSVSGAVVADPVNENNNVYALTYGNGSYPRAVVYAVSTSNTNKRTPITKQGSYTIVFDLNISGLPENKKNMHTMLYGYNDSDGRTDNAISIASTTDWNRNRSSGTVSVNAESGHKISYLYIVNSTSSAEDGTFYLDNVRVYYKPTVKINTTGIPDTAYIGRLNKTSAGTSTFNIKNYWTVNTELPELYGHGYTFMGWQDENGNPITSSTDKPVTAVFSENKIGINMLTGTYSKATLENTDRQYLVTNAGQNIGKVSLITPVSNTLKDTVKDNNSDTILKVTGTTQTGVGKGNYTSWNVPVQLQAGRRYTITWYIYTDNTSKELMGWLLNANHSGSIYTINQAVIQTSAAKKAWCVENYTFDTTEQRNGFNIQYKMEADGKDATVRDFELYMDNLAVYPQYKITYHNLDGTTKVAWHLNAGKANDVYPIEETVFLWDGNGLKKLGWSTTENDTKAMTSVALHNEDIDLYPVWVDASAEQYLYTRYMNADWKTYTSKVIKAFTKAELITADGSAVELSDKAVVDPVTGASLTVSGNDTLSVKPVGVAGELKLRFTLADDTITTTLHLMSGPVWKPGLNTITGTTEGFTVNGMTKRSEAATAMNLSAYQLGTNPVTDGINDHTTVLYATSQYDYLHQRYEANYNPTIELERPFVYSYDVMSSDTVYTMINGAGGGPDGNIYKDNLGLSKGAWKHEAVTVCLATDATVSKNLVSVNAKDGTKWIGMGPKTGTFGLFETGRYLYMDNISVMPYYKATYVKLDGTTESEYFLHDANGSIMTTFAPNAEKLGTTRYSLTNGGVPVDVTTPVKLQNADITLYAVDPAAPSISDKISVRTGSNAGIRFSASIDAAGNDDISEFGFIVARKDSMDKKNATNDDLKIGAGGVTENTSVTNNFQGQTDKGFAFVGARSYEKNNDVTNYTVEDDGTYSYRGIMVGLDKAYKSYDTDAEGNRLTYTTRYDVVFAARPYVVINGSYFYGGVTTSSMQYAAQAIQNDAAASDADKAFAQNVLENTKKTAQ